MRVLVCGGRDFFNRGWLYKVLDAEHAATPFSALITGQAKGADQIAMDWAEDRGVYGEHYPANWERDGKRAGPIRNQRMLDEGKPERVIAFPGGKGTADMVRRAHKVGLPVLVLVSHSKL